MAVKREWPSNPEQSVDLTQVADLYGVTPRTVRRWVELGRLPKSETPGRFSWKAKSIIQFEEAYKLVRTVKLLATGVDLDCDIHDVSEEKVGHIGTNDSETEKASSQKRKPG